MEAGQYHAGLCEPVEPIRNQGVCGEGCQQYLFVRTAAGGEVERQGTPQRIFWKPLGQSPLDHLLAFAAAQCRYRLDPVMLIREVNHKAHWVASVAGDDAVAAFARYLRMAEIGLEDGAIALPGKEARAQPIKKNDRMTHSFTRLMTS
jgi:hypothetical protein